MCDIIPNHNQDACRYQCYTIFRNNSDAAQKLRKQLLQSKLENFEGYDRSGGEKPVNVIWASGITTELEDGYWHGNRKQNDSGKGTYTWKQRKTQSLKQRQTAGKQRTFPNGNGNLRCLLCPLLLPLVSTLSSLSALSAFSPLSFRLCQLLASKQLPG
ncbi:uncharacterized protein Dyak_GE28860 [Drosophila yakuba]|uniref:Uncharacterized protein n=1 Tax=Drosophila yakuba TaxID=7245 RepID=A0A0R1DNH9_DROYA|nr:uncharacterized protein Dyak_GE28860 [Drosophila yakuba]